MALLCKSAPRQVQDTHIEGLALKAETASGWPHHSRGRRREEEPVEQDHYTVLGVTPQSAQAAIRSAYLALMRRCHPDADPGGAAAEQARAINQAYSVLGDPRKRERYDSSLASMRALRFDPVAAERAPARRSRIGPAAAIGVTLLAAGMVAFAIMGAYRLRELPNILPSATGARHAVRGGSVHLP